jgi:hypothetical protein
MSSRKRGWCSTKWRLFYLEDSGSSFLRNVTTTLVEARYHISEDLFAFIPNLTEPTLVIMVQDPAGPRTFLFFTVYSA